MQLFWILIITNFLFRGIFYCIPRRRLYYSSHTKMSMYCMPFWKQYFHFIDLCHKNYLIIILFAWSFILVSDCCAWRLAEPNQKPVCNLWIDLILTSKETISKFSVYVESMRLPNLLHHGHHAIFFNQYI